MRLVLLISLLCAGAGLIFHGKSQVFHLIESHELNPLELKGSPYGEIIGMALQDPVHLLWHGGKGHEHIGKEGEECEECGVDHSADGTADYLKGKPLSARMKLKMLSMENAIRQNNNPTGRSQFVISFEKKRAEKLMFLAYDLDPTNYGNFNAVAHFCITSPSSEKRGRLMGLAENTLKACEGRFEDPEDSLTAASAAETILVWKAASLDDSEYHLLEEDYRLLVDKSTVFEESYQRALEEGRLVHCTQGKLDEMVQRYQMFNYSIREYKKKIDAAKAKEVSPVKEESEFRFDQDFQR